MKTLGMKKDQFFSADSDKERFEEENITVMGDLSGRVRNTKLYLENNLVIMNSKFRHKGILKYIRMIIKECRLYLVDILFPGCGPKVIF